MCVARTGGAGISCVYIRDIHVRLAHRANRLCSLPYGREHGLFPSLFHTWIWVPDVNTLITL